MTPHVIGGGAPGHANHRAVERLRRHPAWWRRRHVSRRGELPNHSLIIATAGLLLSAIPVLLGPPPLGSVRHSHQKPPTMEGPIRPDPERRLGAVLLRCSPGNRSPSDAGSPAAGLLL